MKTTNDFNNDRLIDKKELRRLVPYSDRPSQGLKKRASFQSAYDWARAVLLGLIGKLWSGLPAKGQIKDNISK